jgi:homocysteine S-methyltransferase
MMHTQHARYRKAPPQLGSRLFLTDAGLETDMIFNHGFELPAFAAHTMLDSPRKRAALTRYFRGFLNLTSAYRAGFLLDCLTWRAQGAYAGELNTDETELWKINHRAVAFAANLRYAAPSSAHPIVLNGVIGPSSDAYAPTSALTTSEARDYHGQQIGWLAETQVDCVTALTFNNADEAAGVVQAAVARELPVAVSFTVETDGTLPSGQPLAEAIADVDLQTGGAAMYFMVNCAHPDHFAHVLTNKAWARRVRGLRCNASRCSHAELDECETLDAGDPVEMGQLYREVISRMPWINIVGGCCGSDLRHVTQIASALAPMARRAS